MKFKDKIFDAIKGFFIGLAFLIPGVSGGTVALITKVYDKLISAMSALTKQFWTSFKTLIPIGIGVAIAMVSMWKPLQLATTHILFALVCLFAGCMIGSIPDIVDNVKNTPWKKRHYLYLLVAIVCGTLFGVLSYHLNLDVSSLFNPVQWKLYLIIIPVGFLAASGIVVPGISGSMMLLVLGFYTHILSLTKGMFSDASKFGSAIGVLACMAIGVILGMIFFSKLMKVLFKKFNLATYIWIIGLVIGSIFSLFYNHDIMAYYHRAQGVPWWEFLLGAIFFIIGLLVCYYLVIYQRKHRKNNTDNETR